MKYHSNNGKNYTLVYLNEETVKDWIELHPTFDSLSLAHKADYVRVNIIYKYGGIWLDADTIVMNNLNELFNIIENSNAFYMKEDNTTYVNGVFGSIKEHHIIKEIKEKIDEKINDVSIISSWSFIGSQVFNPILIKYNNFHTLNGLDTIYPVNYDIAKKVLLESPYNDYIKYVKDFQPLFVLVNSVYKNFTNKNILQEIAPINYFLKK